ncbi:MAG TPA: tyrosine-type recombinase/integrase, partial [Burkholderiales bacterium]|nr:tyrosine-type recombinase/integrase [Burkholderiales bacterium]
MPTTSNVVSISFARAPRRFRLTKAFVDKLPYAPHGQVIYWDITLPGFGVRVGRESKTYIAEGRVHRRTCRVKIGRHGIYTPEFAREAAKRILLEMSQGKNPNFAKRQQEAHEITLKAAFDDYLSARELRPITIRDYKRLMDECFVDWMSRPVGSITKDMVQVRHAEVGKRGRTQANNAMRVLRAVLNFAMAKYEDGSGNALLHENPVRRLSQVRAWYRDNRRQTVIRSHELGSWLKTVLKLPTLSERSVDTTVRDLLLLLLFTGLRRSEAARLAWDDVDFQARTITARQTKNHGDHTLPMPQFVLELLRRRREIVQGPFVFPGVGVTGLFVEPRKQMALVTRATGVSFTLHDLRRTFITVAESLDIPAYALK